MANTKKAKSVNNAKGVKAKGAILALRVDAEMVEQLDFIAQSMDRSRANICAIALREFVDREYPFHHAIAEGLRDLEAGRVISHNEWQNN